jgi:hypothetical protein
MPVSEFIRQAVEQKCNEAMNNTLDVRLADVIGIVSSKRRTTRSRRTGKEFTRILLERKKAGR